MRRVARRAWGWPAGLLGILATAVACGALMLVPADSGATAVTHRGGPAQRGGAAQRGGLTAPEAPTASGTGQAFGGVAAVGALFTMSSGKLGSHFCTASVVNSAHGDLAVTAAHCVTGKQGQIVFVPGYANGREPYGIWQVTAVYTDQAWLTSQNPDDDVAFLRLSNASDGVPIEDITGAEQIDTGWQAPALVQVIGYPDGAGQPVLCANWTKTLSPTQLEFDCGGYTDGTSGGPFLAHVSAVSGQGTIIGVIGGYEQGGDTAAVSYASAFGTAVAALYQTAEAGG
jgi:V8-like Glu-specific endopeptidase